MKKNIAKLLVMCICIGSINTAAFGAQPVLANEVSANKEITEEEVLKEIAEGTAKVTNEVVDISSVTEEMIMEDVGLRNHMEKLSSSVYASDNEITKNNIKLELLSLGHGMYTQINGSNMKRNADVVLATPTQYDDIYHVDGDQYVIKVSDGDNDNIENEIYLLTEKKTLDLNNDNENRKLYEENELPSEYIERIQKTIEKQQAINNNDFRVSMYIPKENIQTASGSQEDTVYYEYDGYNFKDVVTVFEKCSSGMEQISKGEETKRVANDLVEFVILGGLSYAFPIFGAAMSAYEFYEIVVGPVFKGDQKDELAGNIIYDKYEKLTALATSGGSYTLGYCISSKVDVDRIDIYEYYAETGESILEKQSIKEEAFSDSYKTAAKKILDVSPETVHSDDELYTNMFRDAKFYF